MLHNNLYILLISETKIDFPFSTGHFQIEAFVAYKLERDFNGGDILPYIREDIKSTLLNSDMPVVY